METETALDTKPTEVDEERFLEMLNVLPPCRWHHANGWELFHVLERIEYNTVVWFAQSDGRFFEMYESCFSTSEYLVQKLNSARHDN